MSCESRGERANGDHSKALGSSQTSTRVGQQPAARDEPSGGDDASAQRAPDNQAGPLEPQGHVQEAELRDLPGGVVDGDTFKVVGYAESLRLLHIDTEELLHKHADRDKAHNDWKGYLREKTEGDGFQTFGTPMGDRAQQWARDFFEGVDKVWLEYESATRTHGFFDRHLVYAWVKDDDGKWVNYNLEAVRAGMSAYYTKYGFSESYHERFKAAEREARQAKRGIWAPDAKSYPDYEARSAWMDERAEQIMAFRERFDDDPRYVDLATDTAYATLRSRLGRRLVVFGEVEYFATRGDPDRIRMNYRYRRDFMVVAFEPVDFRDGGVDPDDEEFIYVEGKVGLYRGDPQLRFDEQSWIRSGKNPPPAE
ncbi:MAG: thermonuclease family protein [Persicimonas sp.]